MLQAEQKWKYEFAPCFSHPDARKISETYDQAFQNVFNNLDIYIQTLNEGVPLEQAKRTLAFVHNEKDGLLAIDQRPPAGGVQLRLYIYPHEQSRVVYLTSIGDKRSQQKDIKVGHKYIQTL